MVSTPSQTQTAAPKGNTLLHSALDFEVTLAALRQAIGAEEMMVLHEIDTQAIVRRGGIEIPAVSQILYFHPRYMKRVVELNPRAIIEAPLKFVVREVPGQVRGEAPGVQVNFWSPTILFGRYEGLGALAEELEEVAGRIASVLARS